MNNQFATQFLREDREEVSAYLDSADQLVATLQPAIEKAIAANMSKEEILDIIDNILRLNEDGAAAAPAGGGSTTGGGTTSGATFTSGAGEQYAAGTRRKKMEEATAGCIPVEEIAAILRDYIDKQIPNLFQAIKDKGSKYGLSLQKEDAQTLAAMPSKTNRQGAKNLSAYTGAGFTKAPSGEALKRQIKGVDVENLWDEEPTAMNESRAYSQFKKQTSIRSESERMHEAAKMIDKRLEEITKLLEFTAQMREELSEGNDTLEYKHNTKKVFEKINKKVVEVYSKSKKLG